MDAVRRERDRRHEQGWLAEGVEPHQPDKEKDTGHELQEPGHPDSPEAGRDIDGPAALGKPEEFLWPVDEIAHTETEESQGERHER